MSATKTTYAPRYRVWPPAEYIPPTEEEFARLRATAERLNSGQMYRARLERITDAEIIRHIQLIEILPRTNGQDERNATDYARVLRREMSRRKLVHRSIAILRCQGCSHATERLFEATQKTHPGMKNRSGTSVDSTFFCAACWSGERVDDTEAEEEPTES